MPKNAMHSKLGDLDLKETGSKVNQKKEKNLEKQNHNSEREHRVIFPGFNAVGD